VVGTLLVAGVAFGATSWTVGVNTGKGESQSPTLSSITISSVASPAAANLVYAGGFGDVVVTITNPNKAYVTITAVTLPGSSTYGTGYTNSALSSVNSSCTASNSTVIWAYAATTGAHTLTSPLVVGPNATLTVTFTKDASMGITAPSGCASTYFKMPSLSAITGSAAATGTATTSPATDSWTS